MLTNCQLYAPKKKKPENELIERMRMVVLHLDTGLNFQPFGTRP